MIPTKLLILIAASAVLAVGASAAASWAVTSAMTSSIAAAAVEAVHAKDGKDGTNGTNGKDGETGKNGATGQTGATGRDGANGQSSLAGTGPAGASGLAGAAGAAGLAGAAGADATRTAPLFSQVARLDYNGFASDPHPLLTVPIGVYALGFVARTASFDRNSNYVPVCELVTSDGTRVASIPINAKNNEWTSISMSGLLATSESTTISLDCYKGSSGGIASDIKLTAVPLDH